MFGLVKQKNATPDFPHQPGADTEIDLLRIAK